MILVSKFADSQEHKLELEQGNKEHFWMRYQNALTHYDSAVAISSDYFYAIFNSGNSWYRIAEDAQDSLKTAYIGKSAERFESAIFSAPNKNFESIGYYNQGNCYLYINELKESIESYKNALRKNPTNEEARYNLSYALLKLNAQEEAMDDLQNQIDSVQNEIDKNKKEQEENETSNKSKEKKEQKKNELEKKQEELEQKKKELEQQQSKEEKEQQQKSKEGEKEESKKGGESQQKTENKNEEGDQSNGKEEKGATKKQEAFTLREAKQNLDALKNDEKKVLLRINKKREGERKRQNIDGTREEKDW